jgi:hypothetical protein
MSDNEFLDLLQAHPELWETVLRVLLEFDAKTVA